MANKRISIVIRTHNHRLLLERLLGEIKNQKRVLKPEIVIVDSSSTDGTKELAIKRGCKMIYIKPEKFSHAHTFNLGAKMASGDILIFASVDVIPKNNLWLYYLIKHFGDEKVAGVFGKQEPISEFNLVEEFKLRRMFKEDGTAVAHFSNASGAIRKSVWEKIKYDENVPYQYIGGEDQQLAIEAKRIGYKIIYEPKSIVYHSHKYSIITIIKQAYFIGKNREQIKKWNSSVAMLDYSKRELVKYLIKKRAWVSVLNVFFLGILTRITFYLGVLKSYF